MVPAGGKAEDAYRTIGEVSRDVGVPQHVLRYWETRFPQLKPLQRAGGRRYYRPEDVALLRRIDTLLNHEGYTIAGVLKLFSADGVNGRPALDRTELIAIRDALAAALADDLTA
jgi:DNA-binding transcriptional MerR regulator